jgi:hypothetical protein
VIGQILFFGLLIVACIAVAAFFFDDIAHMLNDWKER